MKANDEQRTLHCEQRKIWEDANLIARPNKLRCELVSMCDFNFSFLVLYEFCRVFGTSTESQPYGLVTSLEVPGSGYAFACFSSPHA